MLSLLTLLVFGGSSFLTYQWIGSKAADSGAVRLRHRLKEYMRTFRANPLEVTPKKVTAALGVAAVVMALGSFLMSWIVLGRPLLAAPVALCAGLSPALIWRLRVSRTRNAFERQLAEALALLASSLRSGVSFPQALETLSRESRLPLSAEWGWVLSEYKIGRPMSAVLETWSRRVPSRSLAFVVSAIAISQTTGGSLAGVLQGVAVMIRKGEQLRERAKSLSAQGKLSGFVVGAMPFGLMAGLGFLAPDLISPLFTTNLGNILFLIICLLVGVGLYFIQRMVSIDV